MARKSAATTNDNPENSIQVLKEATCPTSSGKSTLAYKIGADDTGAIHLKVSGNDGGGFFSNEWVALADIQVALKAWPEDQGITSMTFRKIFRGKSANTPGFLIAVLVAAGLLKPMEGKSRVHQACDPSAFIDSVDALQGGTTTASKKRAPKAKAKANAAPKAKARPQRKTTAKTSKTPRKTTAASRKAK